MKEMCYNKELCDKLMATTEKRLDDHSRELDKLNERTVELFGKIDSLVIQMAGTNKLLWWVVGIFGTVSTGMLAALVGVVLR